MEVKELSQQIYQYVCENDWVSFPEIQTQWKEKLEVLGDVAIFGSFKNLVLWTGLSPTLAEAILYLVREGQVIFAKADLLIYSVDGGLLTLPVAKRPRPDGYTSLHWLPVCLRPAYVKKKGKKITAKAS